jgi:hypothetical protein
MKFDFTSTIAKFYLGMGALLCTLYLVGAISGFKFPVASYVASSSRSSGGSWGYGK